ncbi:MAG: hypothetical protein KGL48_07310 [Sphingomonadales bacterium]|nr:hypothetical protein [Sphingomonadales bacterium]MDE2569173.1 hypothetical protein [Sphingomonadales bacterium]
MPKPTDLLQRMSAMAVLACPATALAQAPGAVPPASGQAMLDVGYQIPRERTAAPALVGPQSMAAPSARPGRTRAAAEAPRRKFEPEWSREIGSHGPSVELAALGGGRADAPSLVHFAFSWNF